MHISSRPHYGAVVVLFYKPTLSFFRKTWAVSLEVASTATKHEYRNHLDWNCSQWAAGWTGQVSNKNEWILALLPFTGIASDKQSTWIRIHLRSIFALCLCDILHSFVHILQDHCGLRPPGDGCGGPADALRETSPKRWAWRSWCNRSDAQDSLLWPNATKVSSLCIFVHQFPQKGLENFDDLWCILSMEWKRYGGPSKWTQVSLRLAMEQSKHKTAVVESIRPSPGNSARWGRKHAASTSLLRFVFHYA